jgi:hypothetical protein
VKRLVPIFGVLVGLVSGLADRPALAQGSVCQSLQQQYVAAVRNSGQVPGQDTASLARALAAAQQAANANNCSSFGFFSPPPTAACPGINNEINRLQSSLRQAGGGGGFNPFFGFASVARSPADQMRDALFANRCEVPTFGGGGGGRTLCVRTCDGYYFPISAGASTGGYRADAQVCEATYGGPGAAELFISSSGDDVANARSLTSKRYGDQPYAFLYRTQFDPICAAKLQDGLRTLGTTSAATSVPGEPAVAAPAMLSALPQLRPRRFEDPETLANAAGDIRPQSVPQSATMAEGSGGVRIVGAGYYNMLLEQQRALAPPSPLN